MTKPREKVMVSFRLDSDILERSRKLARADSRTLTSYLTHLIVKDMLPVQRQRILAGYLNGKARKVGTRE